jgi:hypothetical protein
MTFMPWVGSVSWVVVRGQYCEDSDRPILAVVMIYLT